MISKFLLGLGLLSATSLCAIQPPVFIAHRGESKDAPENTLPAFKMAVERGFGFECDVYLSSDKRVFSFHDSNLKRTTGVDMPCSKASWTDLVSKIDAGGWKGEQWKGTRPALLEEILELARDGRYIYVEIKSGPEIVPYIKKIFEKQSNATPKNALFICFNKAVCAELRKQMPDYKVYWLVGSYIGRGDKRKAVAADYILDALKETNSHGVDMHFDPAVVTAELIKKVRDAGYEFHVWTVDDVNKSLLATSRGAQTVTTNCAKAQADAIKAMDNK